MQGAARGIDVADRRPVGLGGERGRQHDGHRNEKNRAEGSRAERQQAPAQGVGWCRSRKDAPKAERGEEIDRQQRDLVAPEHDGGSDDAGGKPMENRPTRQRPVQAEERNRQVG